MTEKTGIVAQLGEAQVLLPGQIAQALAANDRLKLRLSLLQEAVARARGGAAGGLTSVEEISTAALMQARLLDEHTLALQGVGALLTALAADLAVMLAPLRAARTPEAAALAARAAALAPQLEGAADEITLERISALTSAGEAESFHRLVMDIHKALNALAAATAAENLDGALVHGLTPPDRAAVRAFMHGLHRTAPLAFGHPGLGTTAVRGRDHLTIQNDIGTTDAHVLVVHVTASEVTVTYTDIHRARAKFFIGLFAAQGATWTPLAERAAKGLEEDSFYLIEGRLTGAEPARLAFLDVLGSRLVFLIDWNKARKALQTFLGKSAAISLLAWAAENNYGHRAFLELGGAELVFEAVHRAALGRIRYGARLDDTLGEAGCTEFLRHVLRGTAEGLAAGRGARLIRDEIQAELSRRFETAESAVFTLLVRHLGLSRGIAEGITAALAAPATRAPAARRAKRMEEKADRLTATARDLAAPMREAAMLRPVIDEVENTADALEDCAYMLSLAPAELALDTAPLAHLAAIVTEAVGAMVRAVEAASRLPEGQRADALAALQAIDAVVSAEREADAAERAAFAALMALPTPDARPLALGLTLARALEEATDRLSHAAFSLRDRVLEELSA